MDKSSMSISRNNINSEKINIHLLNYIDSNVIIFSLIGFLLSRTILIGSIAPLGIAFFLGISKVERYRIPIFISTIIGVISSGNSIPYILKYIICLFIFMIISNKIKNINSYLKLSFIGAFIIFPISLGQVILSNKYLYDIITTPSVWEFIKSIMYIAYLYIFIQFKIYTSFINRKKELFIRLNLLNSSVYNSFNLQNTPAPQRSLLYFTNTIFTLNKSPSTLMLKVPP